MDLCELWRGRLSLRRVAVLITSLLRKHGRSSLAAAMHESAEWTTSDYLLARISDGLETANFLFLKANSSEADKLTAPEPIPRPGYEEPAVVHDYATGEEVAGFFQHMNSL